MKLDRINITISVAMDVSAKPIQSRTGIDVKEHRRGWAGIEASSCRFQIAVEDHLPMMWPRITRPNLQLNVAVVRASRRH